MFHHPIIEEQGPFDVAYNTRQVMYHESKTVDIRGPALRGHRQKFTQPGEHRMGLYLVNCDGVVDGLYAEDAHGDNITLERKRPDGTALGVCHDLVLRNIHLRNAYRNGLAVIGGKNITVENFLIEGTNGALPQAGADIEPDPGPPGAPNEEPVRFLTLRNGTISNNAAVGIICDNHWGSNLLVDDVTIIAPASGWSAWLRMAPALAWEHGAWSAVLRNCTFIGPLTHLENVLLLDCKFYQLPDSQQSPFCVDVYKGKNVLIKNPTFYSPLDRQYRFIESENCVVE